MASYFVTYQPTSGGEIQKTDIHTSLLKQASQIRKELLIPQLPKVRKACLLKL